MLTLFRTPFTVFAYSRDLVSKRNPRGVRVHLARSMREAREWADCYDFYDAITVVREGLFSRRVVATELTL